MTHHIPPSPASSQMLLFSSSVFRFSSPGPTVLHLTDETCDMWLKTERLTKQTFTHQPTYSSHILAVTRETCIDFLIPRTGRVFSKQRVSPSIMIGFGFGLVGLVGSLQLVEQLLLLFVEQLLNPILSSNHVSRKSSEEVEVTHILFRL